MGWVDWFNTRRLLGPIGDVPPAEFEAQYYAQAAVALFNEFGLRRSRYGSLAVGDQRSQVVPLLDDKMPPGNDLNPSRDNRH